MWPEHKRVAAEAPPAFAAGWVTLWLASEQARTLFRLSMAPVGVLLAAAIALGLSVYMQPAAARAVAGTVPLLKFSVFARTGLPLGGLFWAGSRWILTVEGGKQIYALDANGRNLRPWARVPDNRGEIRCIASPAGKGFIAGSVYCHASGGQVYRIGASGTPVTRIAMLPTRQTGDGSLALDAASGFGPDIVAASGGSDAGQGGTVYAVGAAGHVRKIATYAGPGGAENILMAPRGFGALTGEALLAIDKHDRQGRLLAVSAGGAVSTVVSGLAWGLNPMAAITKGSAGTSGPLPGLYLADWKSHNILFAPASEFGDALGSLLVGTERHGLLYLLKPSATAYRLTAVRTNLTAPDYNIEAAAYIGG